jgi:hypothetical protein
MPAALSERAGLPFERILACVGVGWQAGTDNAKEREKQK